MLDIIDQHVSRRPGAMGPNLTILNLMTLLVTAGYHCNADLPKVGWGYSVRSGVEFRV